MRRVVGQNFAAFAATALVFYVAVVAAIAAFTRAVAGTRAAWIAALLTATMPVVVQHASTVSVDLMEASALMAGALLLGRARDDRAGLLRGLVAGLCFGVAVLCRETSVLPLAGLAPLFLLGRPVPRRVLVAAGVGLAIVLGGEALFQYALTGEPLRRYTIAFHHDEHIDRAANMEGNFLLWPPIDPLLVLLVNDDFGFLFWALAAAMVVGVRRCVPAGGRPALLVLGAMAAASFLLVSVLVTKLVLNPRYFMLPALRRGGRGGGVERAPRSAPTRAAANGARRHQRYAARSRQCASPLLRGDVGGGVGRASARDRGGQSAGRAPRADPHGLRRATEPALRPGDRGRA